MRALFLAETRNLLLATSQTLISGTNSPQGRQISYSHHPYTELPQHPFYLTPKALSSGIELAALWNWQVTYIRLHTSSVEQSLLEKLTGSQLVKKFPEFCGTRRVISAFREPAHLSISWTSSIQSMPPRHFLKIHFNITLPSTPWPSKWFFPSDVRTKTLYAIRLQFYYISVVSYMSFL